METTTLFIKSNGLKGKRLFELVCLKLVNHRENNLNDFNEKFSINNVELVIDGDEWRFCLNSKMELIGMTKVW